MKDTTIVPEALVSAGVPWYWLLDIENENLQVFALSNRGMALQKSLFRDSKPVPIPPFEAISISLPVLLGEDDPSS